MIIIVRYYVAGSTCNLLVLNNRGGVHVQYSATVLQYHTGVLILQYCVQSSGTIGLKRVGAWH
jgi:hypothetical protein